MATAAYVTAALERELEAVRAAGPGGRADATFRAAAAIGGFVGGGHLSEAEAEGLVLAAAVASGLPEREARAHVHRGLQRGAKTPRQVPEPGRPATASPEQVRPTPPVLRAVGPLHHPPAAEVAALWERCVPVTEDAAVSEFLRARGIDPEAVVTWDLARALPAKIPCPPWARWSGFAWTLTGHRLLLRCWDAHGRFASLRARRLQPSETSPKNLAPAGFTTCGLVLADALGVQLLRGAVPDWWTRREVVVSEGETDWLTWATRQSDADGEGPAFLGIWSGGWTPAFAARVPTGASVVIRTDPDEAGDLYAADVAESLSNRCTCYRPQREPTP